MRYRLLGASGPRVSELFLGAMTFSEQGASGPDRHEARRILDAYAAAGGNAIDTASSYGTSEEIVGGLLRGRRDSFVVATKYTPSRRPQASRWASLRTSWLGWPVPSMAMRAGWWTRARPESLGQ